MYNASSNELVRTKTLVKGAIIQIDATPFRRWYENHYALALGRKKASEEVSGVGHASHTCLMTERLNRHPCCC